jgi:betaine-aldehyde dehydrogenase
MNAEFPWADGVAGPWIGGRFVEGQATLVEDHSPSTGELLGRLRLASAAQVGEAVALAVEAQKAWARKPIRDRADLVEQLARRVHDNADRLGEVDSRDTGSPVFPMQETARKGARYMKALAGSALEMQGRTIPASGSGWHVTKPEPWGVVGGITAFNHPTHYSCLKSAPALIAGNAVVIKPSEQAPLSTLLFAELTADLLPDGLLAILPGDAEAGAALVGHPDVPRITFTGSAHTAAAIQRTVAETGLIKSLTFELGGKNPIVVFPDVDQDEVAEAIVRGMNYMRVQGQSCGSTSRLLIHADVKEPIVAKVVERVRQIRVGLPSAPETQMGCLISHAHRDRVLDLIAAGIRDGATVLTGGEKCADNELAAGAFMTPAVVDGVRPGTRLWREEVFGPVLGITTWTTESEAVAMANDTEYGLTASVWSRDIDTALRVADAIDAGYVWINEVETRYTGVPFGGWKQSGIGTEQGIVSDLLQFTRPKAINIAVRPDSAAQV